MRTKKLLIAEDEIAIRVVLEQAFEDLEDRGVELLIALNGQEALSLIQTEIPDLVFLDIMMPVMDGFTVCHKVKNELGMQNIHIVMLTAKGDELDKQRGTAAGADAYITKPFEPDELIHLAEKILGM